MSLKIWWSVLNANFFNSDSFLSLDFGDLHQLEFLVDDHCSSQLFYFISRRKPRFQSSAKKTYSFRILKIGQGTQKNFLLDAVPPPSCLFDQMFKWGKFGGPIKSTFQSMVGLKISPMAVLEIFIQHHFSVYSDQPRGVWILRWGWDFRRWRFHVFFTIRLRNVQLSFRHSWCNKSMLWWNPVSLKFNRRIVIELVGFYWSE